MPSDSGDGLDNAPVARLAIDVRICTSCLTLD